MPCIVVSAITVLLQMVAIAARDVSDVTAMSHVFAVICTAMTTPKIVDLFSSIYLAFTSYSFDFIHYNSLGSSQLGHVTRMCIFLYSPISHSYCESNSLCILFKCSTTLRHDHHDKHIMNIKY